MRDLYLAILLPIPPITMMLFTAYALDAVFRYEFRNKRAAYIFSLVMGILTGASCVICRLYLHQYEMGLEDIALMAGLAIHAIVLMVMLRGKVWKRILAVFMTAEMISSFNTIFESIRSQFFVLVDWTGKDGIWIAFIIFGIVAMILEFIFLFVVARIRRKNDDTPLPLPVIAVTMIALQLFTGLFVEDDVEDAWASDINVIKIVTLFSALMIILLFFYIRVTRKERDGLKDINKINEELIESQTRFFEASAKADSEIRAMRHDMKNNIQVLMLLLEKKEYDRMQEYLQEMGDGLASSDVSSHTGDVIADAIIADKKERAQSAGAELKVSGVIKGVEISPVNMCKILGNLLDNAIEAVEDERLKDLPSDIKVITLDLKNTDNFFMISVTNPCAECPVIEDGMIISSKSDGKNHGFGLGNVRSAAEACGGEMSLSCEEKPYGNLFRAEVVMNR